MWADWLVHVLTTAGFHAVPVDIRHGPIGSGGGRVQRGRRLPGHPGGLTGLPQRRARPGPVGERRRARPGGRAAPDPARPRRRRTPQPAAQQPWRRRSRTPGRERRGGPPCCRRSTGPTPPPRSTAGPAGPRYPGSVPKIWNVRPRHAWFTGRTSVLERLRDQLRGDGRSAQRFPQVLYGLGGVGKTQVAREYAHRFRADYDLVWWIEAEQPDRVVSSLAELAAGDGPQGRRRGGRGGRRPRCRPLRRGAPYSRWLLIFDNVEDLDRAIKLLPDDIEPISGETYGHILATCRNKPASTQVEAMEVEVFTRPESIEHLCRRVTKLPVADADRVADAVGDLPLAVEVAAAWLAETGDAGRRLRGSAQGAEHQGALARQARGLLGADRRDLEHLHQPAARRVQGGGTPARTLLVLLRRTDLDAAHRQRLDVRVPAALRPGPARTLHAGQGHPDPEPFRARQGRPGGQQHPGAPAGPGGGAVRADATRRPTPPSTRCTASSPRPARSRASTATTPSTTRKSWPSFELIWPHLSAVRHRRLRRGEGPPAHGRPHPLPAQAR